MAPFQLHPLKAHLGEIERIDKHVDHANRVALVNEIIEAFGQYRPLPRSASSTKRLISSARSITGES
jgi:hypothetical protein